MNDFVSFSQYFVDKQNIRTFSNILYSKLLKSENDSFFLRNILEDKELLSEISIDLKEILSEMRQNIKIFSKHDFKEYISLKENKRKGLLHLVDKADIVTSCCSILNKIIPWKFYGNLKNNHILNKCIQIIIYTMKNQYFDFKKMIKKWDFSRAPWNCATEISSIKILHIILHWIFKNILSAIISLNFHVTTCKLDSDENKLYYFLKNQWQSFYDKQLSKLIIAKVINKCNRFCSRKNIKNKYSLEEKLKLKVFKRGVFKLHLVLKSNNDYRPIVRYKNQAINSSEKNKIKERLHFIYTLNGKTCVKTENHFSSLYSLWVKNNQPKLYFVKTDLSNAFGSINKEKLLRILFERYLEFQKSEMSLYVKKKFAHLYKEMLAELKNSLLIRAGSTIYEWKKGLVQGYKYSPALSELYYSYWDKIYFSEHFKKEKHEIKFFIRVVDDYLYITDSLDNAYSFIRDLSNYTNINYKKTIVNFQYPNINFSEDITFLGYTYNTYTLEVSRANSVFTGDMCYKICFSPAIVNLQKFIENRIGQSGIQINSHIFNFYHKNEKLIWHHIFVTLCLSANKFCTILAIYCAEKEMSNLIAVYKNRVTVKLCNRIIETLEKNQPIDFIFKYCINHFRYLSFKALLLCAQKTPKCNVLVPHIKAELTKTNCIYGKWKEHSSKINGKGKSEIQAHRDVCKRADLKVIMKCFDDLPKGVQCFNHKLFYL